MIITVVLLILGFKPFAAAADPLDKRCPTSLPDQYPTWGPYEQNVEILSVELRRNASSTPTFAKGSVGAYPGIAYGLALCRGDTANASACGDCVATAFQDAWRLCGRNNDAHLLCETCVLHFSDLDFISYGASSFATKLLIVTDSTSPGWEDWDPRNAEGVDINGVVEALLDETAQQAAYNSTTARYGTARMDVNSTTAFPPLYSLAQCTPDLPPANCWDCLRTIYNDIIGGSS